jgi:hypothetical protein
MTVQAVTSGDWTSRFRYLRVPALVVALSMIAVATPAGGQQEATPGAPRTVAIDWNQVATDLRIQARRFSSPGIAAAPVQQLPIPKLSNATLQDAARTRLPVLLPTAGTLDMGPSPSAMLFPYEDFYTASMWGGGLLVEVFGTRLAHASAPAMARTARRMLAADPDNFVVSRGEGGWDVSFNRYGAAYTVTLECADPEDSRCANDRQVREVARSLLIAGGSPQ